MNAQEQPGPRRDLIAVLSELSSELRTAIESVAAEMRTVQERLKESRRAEGREPEVVAAWNKQQEAVSRLHEIWDRARKPIINLGMMSNYGELLAEFRSLSLRPDALEVLKFVEFLKVVLEIDAPARIAEPSEKVLPQEPQKRPRGRPAKIPQERKDKALEVRTSGGGNREAAKILYGTEEPKKTQRDSVSAILKAHCKKQGLNWPPK